jgi:wyosine [tRNA(Phe)-imidazoG37] synthetase (radical SAM superfamily)
LRRSAIGLDAGLSRFAGSFGYLLLTVIPLRLGITGRPRGSTNMSIEPDFSGEAVDSAQALLSIDEVISLIADRLCDGLDHPEIWADLPEFVGFFPNFVEEVEIRLARGQEPRGQLTILYVVAMAVAGEPERALSMLEPISVANSLSALVQGAVFHIQSLLDPANPKFDLTDRFCATPFHKFDVLDGGTHLCCASWIQESAGNLATASTWQDVWNSPTAQNIRESIFDGSFRYCNKTACPHIGANTLPTKTDMAERSEKWRDIVDNERILLPEGPERVTLAYDKTCNLSCPSCRTEKYAADSAERERFDVLQENAILPMLRETKLVDITGSGDPFASKNFRHLMEKLSAEDYPDLRFQIMTNGMLVTPREWARFPSLHDGRVTFMRVSLDAATGPTHEKLRRGARWPVMEQNLAFISELRKQGQIGHLDFACTVQVDNYREMGDFVDLGHKYGADSVNFLRITNWGTFTTAEYARAAVFMPSHPQYEDFLAAMQDPRLRDPMVGLHDLADFMKRPSNH